MSIGVPSGLKMLLRGQPAPTSQHRRDVIVVSVRFVVHVAVVEVDVGVTRRRRRGGPYVVGPAARIAFALCVAMLPEGELQPCRDEAVRSRSSSPRGPDDAAHRIAPLQRAAANASDIPCRPLLVSAVTDTPMRRRPTAGGMHSRELRRQGHGFCGQPPKKPKIKNRRRFAATRERPEAAPQPQKIKVQKSKVKVAVAPRPATSHLTAPPRRK